MCAPVAFCHRARIYYTNAHVYWHPAGDAECECVDGRADGDRARAKLGSAFEFPMSLVHAAPNQTPQSRPGQTRQGKARHSSSTRSNEIIDPVSFHKPRRTRPYRQHEVDHGPDQQLPLLHQLSHGARTRSARCVEKNGYCTCRAELISMSAYYRPQNLRH